MKTGKNLRDDALLAKHASKPRGFTYPPLPQGEPVDPQQGAAEEERLRIQRQEETEKQREYTRQKHELYRQRKLELAEKTEWFNETYIKLMRATNKNGDLDEARRLVEKREQTRIDIQRLTGQTRRRP